MVWKNIPILGRVPAFGWINIGLLVIEAKSSVRLSPADHGDCAEKNQRAIVNGSCLWLDKYWVISY